MYKLKLEDNLVEDYLDRHDSNSREAVSFAADTIEKLLANERDWCDMNSIFEFFEDDINEVE